MGHFNAAASDPGNGKVVKFAVAGGGGMVEGGVMKRVVLLSYLSVSFGLGRVVVGQEVRLNVSTLTASAGGRASAGCSGAVPRADARRHATW